MNNKITKEDLAKILNNRQYREEINNKEEMLAKENNLVVVFGASDDLIEFRGAFYEEFGAYTGADFYFNKEMTLVYDENEIDFFKVLKYKLPNHIRADWSFDDYSWFISANFPCSYFDVLEDDEKYCRGLIFSLDDLI